MRKIRIGVLGCANIAKRSTIPAILELSSCFELVAVASRTYEKAAFFADTFNCEAIVGYDALLDRADIEAVYIPLPTGLHKEWIIKSLEAGKNVYAEKSIAMNSRESQLMVALAVEKGLALLEGYMFRYHTQHQKVFELLDHGAIGEIRHFKASFGFPPFVDSDNFRYDNEIGGGALKDAAGYVVQAASFILRQELEMKAASVYYVPKTGTSLYGSAYMIGGNGVGASVSFGFDNYYQCNYEIWGSRGKLIAMKAFTPKASEDTILILENSLGYQEINCSACNHFKNAFFEFYKLIVNSEDKRVHYNRILKQSEMLDMIEVLSKK